MAKEIVLNFKINETGEPVQQVIKNAKEMKEVIKDLQSQMEEAEFGTAEYDALAASLESVNEQYAELNKTTKATDDSFASLNKQIKSAKSELDKFKPGTKEYKEAADRLRELKDRMGDVADASKIQGSGFERLQSSFGLLKESVGTADFGKAKIAFSGLGAAMKALPIFLIIEGVKLLIEGFDKFKNSTGVLGTALRAIGDLFSWIGDKISEFTDWIGLTNNKLEEQNATIIKNATEQRGVLEKRYNREIELAKAAGQDTTKLEKEKSNAILKTLKQELDAIVALRKARGEYTEEEIKRIKEISEEVKDIQNKARVTEITETKKHNDEKKKAYEDYAKNQADINKTLRQLSIDNITDVHQKEMSALNEKFAGLRKEFIEKKANKSQLLQLEDEHLKAVAALEKKYSDEKIKKLKESGDAIEKQNYETADAIDKQQHDFNVKYLNDQLALAKERGQSTYKIERQILLQKHTDELALMEQEKQKEIEVAKKLKIGSEEEIAAIEEKYQKRRDVIRERQYSEEEKLYKNLEKINAEHWEKIKQKAIATVGQISAVFNQVASVATGIWQSYNELNDYYRDLDLRKAEDYYDEHSRMLQEATDKRLYDLNNAYAREQDLRKYALAQALDDENLTEQQKADIQFAARAQEEASRIAFENQKIAIQNEAAQKQYELDLKLYEEQEKLKEEAFKADQNMKVAQTIINTINGAFAAFTGMAQAIPGPYGLIAGGIAAAAVSVMGALQVANIKATKYQKGKAPSKPTFTPPVVGTGVSEYRPGTNQGSASLRDSTLFETGGKSVVGGGNKPQQVIVNEGKPIRAYVLAGDVASELDAQSRLERKAKAF